MKRKSDKEIEEMIEKIHMEYEALAELHKTDVASWIAVTYTIQALQWALGKQETLPVEKLIEFMRAV